MPASTLYRVSTDTRLAPFGDAARACLVHNQPLSEHVSAAAHKAGLQLVEVAPGDVLEHGDGLLVFDDVFISAEALDAFAKLASGRAVAVIPDSVFTRTTSAIQGNRIEPHPNGDDEVTVYDLFRVEAGSELTGSTRDEVVSTLLAGATRTLLDPEEKVIELPVVEHYFGDDKVRISFTARPIIRLRHWVHLLWANQTAIGLRWREMNVFRLMLWALWAMVRSFSLNKYRILGKMNVIGAGCDIHPSAVVEGSVLGPGCSIGPHARVRFSTLGAGVIMQPGSQAEFSVVGERALISQNCAVNFSVLYPEAAASHYLVQLCVLGRRSMTVGGSFLLDTHFGSTVKVQLGEEIHDTGQKFLGNALGHDVRIGSGVWIPAGRQIPNGYVLVRSPDDTPLKIDEGLPEGVPLIVSGGKIVPW